MLPGLRRVDEKHTVRPARRLPKNAQSNATSELGNAGLLVHHPSGTRSKVELMNRLPRVLLVDDELGIRMALQRVLISAGFEVSTAGSAAEALEAIASGKRIDVILTDLEMPGMHGLELIRAVRALDANVPIIVLTGHRNPGWVPQGALKCFDKPVQLDMLIETLRAATRPRSGYDRVGACELTNN